MSRFDLIAREDASESAQKAMDRAREGFGMVPNLISVMACSGPVANAYLDLHEALGESSFTEVEQQVVTLTASFENGCDYCMAAESGVARTIDMDEAVLAAIRTGEALPDDRLNELAAFTRRVVAERGWVGPEAVDAFLARGFTKAQVLEVVLGVTKKTLSNYVNHIAETPLDEAFQPLAWEKPETAGV